VSVFTHNTYVEIAKRLADLRPPIRIEKHIAFDKKKKKTSLEPQPTTLDGINFKVVNRAKLEEELTTAVDPASGGRAFTNVKKEDQSHWALKLSLVATKGTGYRQISRLPPLSDRPLSARDRFGDADFAARFGDDMTMPHMTSLHVGVTDDACNVHIDDKAFVLEGPDGEVFLMPDLGGHTVDELFLKTTIKGLIPSKRVRGWVDRLTLLFPGLRNNYTTQGYKVKDAVKGIPVVNELGSIPLIGPLVNNLPVPTGVSIDFLRRKNFKVKLVLLCGKQGACSAAFDVGGIHDLLGRR
jgi:hypothetical protein